MIGRIYGIRDKRDGRIVYVGSTTQALYSRWGQHLSVLSSNCKYTQRISIHLLENGPLNFEVVVLEELELSCAKAPARKVPKLRECEQKWMDKYENLVNGVRAVRSTAYIQRWSCICGLTGAGNISHLKIHMRSKKHKRRMEGWKEIIGSKVLCTTCSCLLSNLKHNMAKHRKTEKHKRNLKLKLTADDV